jgi:acyl carrier protein
VIEALGLDPDEVQPSSTIMGDLGAESIDLLDILYRLERKVGIKLKAADLSAYLQGDIPEGEFDDDDDIVQPAAIKHLKTVMPQYDFDAMAGTLRAPDVVRMFSVQNLADLAASRRGAAAAS